MGLSFDGIKASPSIVKNVMNALLHQNPTLFTCNEKRGMTYAKYLAKQFKQISELELESKVFLIGYHTDLQKYVQACDIAVSASLREGLGLNLLEAMYCKKPIVAADNRGHRELVDKKTGYLVKPKDADAFAECIVDLCQNIEKRIKMGENGYEKSKKYWDVNVLKELQDIYGV